MREDGGELITFVSTDDATVGLPAVRELVRAAEALLVGDGFDSQSPTRWPPSSRLRTPMQA
eukprot:4045177-Alexandrium_andersonii.AAC.1